MGARGEVVREPVPWSSLPVAKAWLLGHVRTDVPGYREIEINGNLYVVPSSASYRFDELVTAINAIIVDIIWSASSPSGVTGVGAAGESYPERLGWLLGMIGSDTFPGFSSQFALSPAGIPLLGATWDSVTTEVERRQIVDRHRRNQGFVWGAAEVFRCVLTMHRWSLQALETGWCLRGKVTIGGATKLSTPVGLSDPDGQITGYVLGVDGVEWLDQTQTHARVTMSIVKE